MLSYFKGNFSFALSLVNHLEIPAANVTATAYDSEVELNRKYPDAADHLRILRESGATILLGVDARSLDKRKDLKRMSDRIGGFSKVVWNFPHAGALQLCECRNILHAQARLS